MKQLQIPSPTVIARNASDVAIPSPTTQSSKQSNPLTGLVTDPEPDQIPAIKSKTKLDEVTEAAITIFGGRVLEQS